MWPKAVEGSDPPLLEVQDGLTLGSGLLPMMGSSRTCLQLGCQAPGTWLT